MTDSTGQIVKADSITTASQLLVKYEKQIRMALPAEVSVKRLMRVALTTWNKTPALKRCSAASLCGAVIGATQLGLDVDSNLGHAYLVPYGQECTLIIGYRGMLELAYRSDRIGKIESEAVYEGDAFTVTRGSTFNIDHKPCFEDDPDKITHVYAIATLSDGNQVAKVMTRKQVDTIRHRSRAGKSGPWVTDYEAMALKTVIRRLCKHLPVSVTVQRAVGMDEAADANLSQKLDVEWQAVTETPIEVEATPIEVEATPIDEPTRGETVTAVTDSDLRKQCGEMAVEACGDDRQAIGDWFEQVCGKRSIKAMKGGALVEAHGKITDAFLKWSKE